MSTPLPSAEALINHADDRRHTLYASWVIPKFFPYIRDLLNELAKQPAHENLARGLMNSVFAQPSNIGCPCLILIEKLRAAFKAYGERGMSEPNNHAWRAVSVAMIYFILATDLHFTAMSDQMTASHLAQLLVLEFAGPRVPTQFLQPQNS